MTRFIATKISRSLLFIVFFGALLFSGCELDDASTINNTSNDEIDESTPWGAFLALFPALEMSHELPLEIDSETIKKFEQLSTEQCQMLEEETMEFGMRMPIKSNYFSYGKHFETAEVVALIYFEKSAFMDSLAPIAYTLVTFTRDGKLIEKQLIGGRKFLGDNILKTTLEKNQKVKVNVMKPTYKKNPLKHGYSDNPMLSMKKIAQRKYKVSPEGKIVVTAASKNDVLVK